MHANLYILAIIGSMALASNCLGKIIVDDESLDILHHKIFEGYDNTDFDYTYESLVKLAADPTGRYNSRIIKSLAAVGNISIDKCDWNSIEQIHSLESGLWTREVRSYPERFRPYLLNCVFRQFGICKDVFRGELEKAVENLGGENKKFLNDLEKIFNPRKDKYFRFYLDRIEPLDLDRGLIEFFHPNDSRAGDKSVSSEQVKTVIDRCTGVERIAWNAASVYFIYRIREGLVSTYGDFESEWAPKINICQRILSTIREEQRHRARVEKERLTELERQRLKEAEGAKEQKPKKKKLFGWFQG